jgi:hypothetical protein
MAERADRRAGDPAVVVRRLVAELGVLGVELAVAFRTDAWSIGPDAVPARLEVGWEARAKPPVAPPPLLSQMRLLVRPARPSAAAPIDAWQAERKSGQFYSRAGTCLALATAWSSPLLDGANAQQ